MFDERLERLIERWKAGFGQYEHLKAEAELAVVRWEWTTGERYSELPFHFQRFPGRGRVVKGEPGADGYFTRYGFDVEGCVRLHREYSFLSKKPAFFSLDWFSRPDSPEGLLSETFYRYSKDHIESIQYSVAPQIPLSVQQIFLENTRVIFFAGFRLNGYTQLYSEKGKDPDMLYEWLGYNGRFKTAEAYIYETNHLKTILSYYESPGVPPYSAREHFTYDDGGKLLRIDRIYEDGMKYLVYRKRQKGQTFSALRKEATSRLVEAIVQRVKVADIQERLYCIELNYQKVSQHFPPCIVAVPERYRLEVVQSDDPDECLKIFLPIFGREWFYTIDDPDTLEVCQELEQEIQAGEKWDTATRILRDVAKALNRVDWSGICQLTPDFVVFALDPEMEGDHVEEVLHGCGVSQKQIQEWTSKGWLRNT